MEKHTNGRRQILMALASLAGGLLLPGTGRAALQTQEAHHMLVVFYSHTGNTRAIARHIQALTGCDLLDLEPVTPYPRDYDTVVSQAKKEKQQGFLPPLKNPLDMVSRYDVILVGSPSWWGTFAGPVRTFLSTAALDGKTLVPFITHEGSGLGSAPADLRRLCPASQIREGWMAPASRWNPGCGRRDCCPPSKDACGTSPAVPRASAPEKRRTAGGYRPFRQEPACLDKKGCRPPEEEGRQDVSCRPLRHSSMLLEKRCMTATPAMMRPSPIMAGASSFWWKKNQPTREAMTTPMPDHKA